ncbi:MAG: hypothetical protein CV089_18050 [Nitrospira sp. WS110]|nr:hypothetical protein [Nitrospira sp. WS110]
MGKTVKHQKRSGRNLGRQSQRKFPLKLLSDTKHKNNHDEAPRLKLTRGANEHQGITNQDLLVTQMVLMSSPQASEILTSLH